MAIRYDRLWKTLENKGMTKYTLTHYFELSPRLITKLQRNEPINTTTIDKLCSILECRVEDILFYEEDKCNTLFREAGIKKISEKQRGNQKKKYPGE